MASCLFAYLWLKHKKMVVSFVFWDGFLADGSWIRAVGFAGRPCSCRRVVMAQRAGIHAPTRCTFRKHQDGGFSQLMMLVCSCENTGTCLVQCQGFQSTSGFLPWLFLVLLVGFVYATFFFEFGFVWQAFEGHKKIQKATLRTPPFDGWCCILSVLRGKLVWLTGDVSRQKWWNESFQGQWKSLC